MNDILSVQQLHLIDSGLLGDTMYPPFVVQQGFSKIITGWRSVINHKTTIF